MSRSSLKFVSERMETWPLDRLKPFAKNARVHGAGQVAKIAASMAEFGWTVPCLVGDDGELIAGHGRVLAARQLGLTEVPVIVVGHLTHAQRRAYRIADNRLTELGEWNDALLSDELKGLVEDEFDVSVIGFDEAELNALIDGDDVAARQGEDEIPDTSEDPVTQRGDLWILGNHRLLCGDATVAPDVERLLGTVKPLLMVTDPPYGVQYDAGWRKKAGLGTKRTVGDVLNDDRADWREAWALYSGDVAYVWHDALRAAVIARSLEAVGFKLRNHIVWAKEKLVPNRGHYHWQHETCWYAVRKNCESHWAGNRKQSTLWQIARPGRTSNEDVMVAHGTQKPVECMRRGILNNSRAGQAVYDPFMGSGTTLIAAETTGRVCLGIELNPVYVDVAVERWQTFTGSAALLDGSGRSFAELKSERLGETSRPPEGGRGA